MDNNVQREKNCVNSVTKAFQILDLLMKAPNCKMSIKEIVSITGWNRTTVYRFLQTLAENGFVEATAEKQIYRVTFKLLDMSNTMLDNLDVKGLSQPYMVRLVNKWKTNCNLAIPDYDRVVVIHNIKYDYIKPPQHIGHRGNMASCGTGKAMLSTWTEKDIKDFLTRHKLVAYTDKTITDKDVLFEELMQIKSQGYALDRGEYLYGNYCIAAPIIGASHCAVAAISLSTSPEQFLDLPMDRVISDIKEAASNISSQLGFEK